MKKIKLKKIFKLKRDKLKLLFHFKTKKSKKNEKENTIKLKKL